MRIRYALFGNADKPLCKMLLPEGFQHCAYAEIHGFDDHVFVVLIDPTSRGAQTYINHDIIDLKLKYSHIVRLCSDNTPNHVGVLKSNNCVKMLEYFLGINTLALTPKQLYTRLVNNYSKYGFIDIEEI